MDEGTTVFTVCPISKIYAYASAKVYAASFNLFFFQNAKKDKTIVDLTMELYELKRSK